MSRSQIVRGFWLILLLTVVASMALPLPAFAQSCSLCYTQAAGANAKLIHALRNGILILMIPPMVLSVAVTVLAYSKRNRFRRSEEEREADQDW